MARGLRGRLCATPVARGREPASSSSPRTCSIVCSAGSARSKSRRDVGDFRLVDRKALDSFLAMPERDPFLRGMFSWIGFRQAVVPFHRPARAAGETKLFARQDAASGGERRRLLLRRAAARGLWLGLAVCAIAAAYALFVVTLWVAGADLARGWSSIIVVTTFLGGANMLMTGVLGVYIGRIHAEVKRRPLYFVDRAVGFEAQAASERRRARRPLEPSRRAGRAPGTGGGSVARLAGGGGRRRARDCDPDQVRHDGRRRLAHRLRRALARRGDALSRFPRTEPARLAVALLAGGGAGARAGLPSEAVVSAFGFAAAGAAMALERAHPARRARGGPGTGAGGARRARRAAGRRPSASATIWRRVFGVPFLAVALARARGAPVSARLAVLAGLGAGAMAAIKPPYALIGALLALYLAARLGLARRAARAGILRRGGAGPRLCRESSARCFRPMSPTNGRSTSRSMCAVREPAGGSSPRPARWPLLLIAATAAWAARERIAEPEFAIAGLAAARRGSRLFRAGQGLGLSGCAGDDVRHARRRPSRCRTRRRAPRGVARRRASRRGDRRSARPQSRAGGGHRRGGGFRRSMRRGRASSGSLPRLAPFALAAAVGAACGALHGRAAR